MYYTMQEGQFFISCLWQGKLDTYLGNRKSAAKKISIVRNSEKWRRFPPFLHLQRHLLPAWNSCELNAEETAP